MPIEGIEIIVGTYEEFLLGYKLTNFEKKGYSFIQSFATHSHQASIRCVATGGKFLASGSADETIHLYDMITRKEAGVLGHHNGTVSCLEFSPNGSHLLSGSDDGGLAVCRTGSWQLEKLWGAAHKGSGVYGLSVHPTAKLALSVGGDGTLRTWNLVKGRQAYATRLGSKRGEGRQVSCVCWSPDGQLYAVAMMSRVDIYSVGSAGIVHVIQGDKKVTCLCFVDDDEVCVGSEGGDLSVHSISQKRQLTSTQAHQERVKCVASVASESSDDKWLVSASSAGNIKFWQYLDGELCDVCEASTGCRITCLVVLRAREAVKEEDSKCKTETSDEIDVLESTEPVKKGGKNKTENLETSVLCCNSAGLIKSIKSMGRVLEKCELLEDGNRTSKKKRKKIVNMDNNTDISSKSEYSKKLNDVTYKNVAGLTIEKYVMLEENETPPNKRKKNKKASTLTKSSIQSSNPLNESTDLMCDQGPVLQTEEEECEMLSEKRKSSKRRKRKEINDEGIRDSSELEFTNELTDLTTSKEMPGHGVEECEILEDEPKSPKKKKKRNCGVGSEDSKHSKHSNDLAASVLPVDPTTRVSQADLHDASLLQKSTKKKKKLKDFTQESQTTKLSNRTSDLRTLSSKYDIVSIESETTVLENKRDKKKKKKTH